MKPFLTNLNPWLQNKGGCRQADRKDLSPAHDDISDESLKNFVSAVCVRDSAVGHEAALFVLSASSVWKD